MTRLQKALFSFLSIIVCLLVILAVWFRLTRWQQPLGPPLQIETVTPFKLPATWTPDPRATEMPSATSTSTAAPALAAKPLPPAQNTGLCEAPPVMNILAIGADTRGNNYNYGLADVIRLLRVDSVNAKVTILEIPRDLWVEIPDIADNLNGQDHEKLNQAYLYGNPGMGYTDDPAQGPGLLARTLTLNFGTQIDHYAAVNMRTFEKIVNAVGGIDVILPEPVDGRTPEDMNSRLLFEAGAHHLNGTEALTLARIRIKGGFERGENQNRVLCALREKLTSPTVAVQIPDLIRAFRGAIQTDLSPEQLSQLACLGTKMPSGNVVFANFPAKHFEQTRQYDPVFKKRIAVLEVDFKILREYIRQFHEGTWPAQEEVLPAANTGQEEASFCP